MGSCVQWVASAFVTATNEWLTASTAPPDEELIEKKKLLFLSNMKLLIIFNIVKLYVKKLFRNFYNCIKVIIPRPFTTKYIFRNVRMLNFIIFIFILFINLHKI